MQQNLPTEVVTLMTLPNVTICLLAIASQQNILRLAEFELGDELARVKLEARLDDGAIRKIRESVAEVVKASAKQRAADGRTRSNGLVDLEVAEAISRAIKERAGEGAMLAYLDGWQRRRKFFKETAISQAIVVMDQRFF